VGKKFTRGVVSAVLIIVSIVLDYEYPGAGNWLRAISAGLMAAGISGLANLAIGAIFGPRRGAAPPLNVTLRGTIEFRRLIFGSVRTGGVLVHYGTSGSNGDDLWYVIAYAGHQSSAFHDFWLDERRIASSDIPSGAGGVVTASPWNSKLAIYKHLGTSAQTVDTNLDAAFTEWTTNHKLQGITYAAIKMTRDTGVFPDGAPSSASCLLDGMLTYDPRKDSTNGGSGSHRYTNPSTWEFSRDPVQHIRWYMTGGSVHNDITTLLVRYGCGESNSRLDDAYTIASSNVCDQTLSGANAPPSGSQSRYRCDLEAHCGETRREILGALLASMAGNIFYVRGKWRILAGAYDAPSHTLTQDDIYDDDFKVDDTVGHDKRYNAVSPVFIDASQQYIQTTGVLRTDSSYETQDGGERIPITLTLDAVTDQYQAQRIAEIHLRKSRMMRSMTLPGALNLLPVALFETLTFSHTRYGWTNRVFRCLQRTLNLGQGAGRVDLICQREDSGVWTDLLTADYTTGTSSTDVFQQDGPNSPTGLTATAIPNGIQFKVTLPSYFVAGSTVELYQHTASTPFGSASKIAAFTGDTFILTTTDTTTRYYWVLIRDQRGAVSGTYPASTGQAGAADAGINTQTAAISSVTISNVQHIPDGFSFNDTLATLSYTPSVNCVIEITATFTVDYTTDGAGTGVAQLQMSIQDGTYDGFKEQFWYDKPGAGLGSKNAVTIVRSFSGSAGVGVTYTACAAKFASGDTVTCSNGQMILKAFR
jgi:hypothetical protein